MRALVADIETTGKNDPKHRIIEISMAVVNLEPKPVKLLQKTLRFNPERNIDAAALAIHKIPLSELKHEPTFDSKAGYIAAVIDSCDVFVAHNGAWFDGPFIKRELERCGVPCPAKPIFDTMLYGSFATPFGKRPTLGELAFSLGVDYDPDQAHSGAYDTDVLTQCLILGMYQGWFETDHVLNRNNTLPVL